MMLIEESEAWYHRIGLFDTLPENPPQAGQKLELGKEYVYRHENEAVAAASADSPETILIVEYIGHHNPLAALWHHAASSTQL